MLFSACCVMKVFCILGANVCLLIQWQSFVPAPGIDHKEPSVNGFLSVILSIFPLTCNNQFIKNFGLSMYVLSSKC